MKVQFLHQQLTSQQVDLVSYIIMKLVVVSFSFIIFIFRVSSLEIDPTDDKTVLFFLDHFLEGGDPSTFESIRAEVKKHSSELLSGFLSLAGDSFDFTASDMKTQLKKFEQDFDFERLLKVVEDIFGIGNVVVSQLQKNSGTVKKKMAAFIDNLMSELGFTRKKRSNAIKPEIYRVINHVPSVKRNKHKKIKHTNIITPSFKFQNDDGESDIPSPNGGSETKQLESVIPSGVIPTGNNGQLLNGIRTPKIESNNGFLGSVIPNGKKQKDGDGEKQKEGNGEKQKEDIGEKLSHDISIPNGPPGKRILSPVNLDSKKQKDKGKELSHDIPIQNGTSDKGIIGPVNLDSKKLKDKGEELSHDIPIQNGPADKGILDPLDLDSKKQKDNGEKLSRDITIQNGPADKGILDPLDLDSKTQKDNGEKLSRDITIQNGPSDKIEKSDTKNQKENNHETESNDDDMNKGKTSEEFENFRKLEDLSHELKEEFINITEMRTTQLQKNVWKATDAIKEYVDKSKDRVLNLFTIYGNYLYDIFATNAEQIKTIFQK